MDDLGNRAGNQILRDDGMVNFAVDTLTNRYTSVGPNSLAYDDAGNLTTDRDSYIYTYDYENRITKVEKPDGPDAGSDPDPVAQFAYDTQGRRIRVYDAVAATTKLYYYADQWQVLSQYSAGTLDKSFVYGNYIDEVLVMNDGANDYFYVHDHLYSPAALVNNAGSVVERYEYDAYGKCAIWDNNLQDTRMVSSYRNITSFHGHDIFLVADEKLLMDWRYRSYDVIVGRLFQRDIYGLCPDSNNKINRFSPTRQYHDGLCLLSFMQSNPQMKMDAFGLSTAGQTYCDPEVGSPFTELFTDKSSCSEIPTAAHEEVHYEQQKPCCALASKCHKKYGGYSACMAAYNLWHQVNKPFHEAEAYEKSASVAEDLYNMSANGTNLPNQGNCTCLSYRDIYLNDIDLKFKHESESRKSTGMACPFTQEGDINFEILIQRGFGDEIGKWL